MANTIVSGMQWGDEGKGKIVDLICPAFDGVVRFQGGDNAGHTVRFGDNHFALHLVPSGMLHEGMTCVLGNGMVINPATLFAELKSLGEAGVRAEGRLYISDRAHVNLPVYGKLDQAREEAAGRGQIGTTARGIGPAYESKVGRRGLRMCDLFAEDLESRLRRLIVHLEREIVDLGGQPIGHPGRMLDECMIWRERLEPFIVDTAKLLNERIAEGRSFLFEGAQGTLLDIDHGTYPYVTSSSPSTGGAVTGSGVPLTLFDGVIGVLKAYTTRVGGGPFVAELTDQTGGYLRTRGNEFGTTTGRPRRCGWLDLVAARHTRMVSGIDSIALTKFDVLDSLDEIKVCVAYRLGGREITSFPARTESLQEAEPVYRTVKGWRTDTAGCLAWEELPQEARYYVEFIEEELDAPVSIVSTGPRREETMIRDEPRLQQLLGGRLDAVLEQRGRR